MGFYFKKVLIMSKQQIVEQQTDWVADPQNALLALDKQANANIQALATQLGYDGSLTVGALEDEIRFYQRRTVEACLELGKRLLLLKEMTPHGEFKQPLELLNFSYRSAARFMQAALKTSKSATVALLAKQSDHSGKFLELITLDDEELVELTEGGSARGITLDNISTMSVTELRKALRDAKADTQAKDELLAKKNEKIDQLDAELTKRTQLTPDARLLERQEQERTALDTLHESSRSVLLAVQQFYCAVNDLNQFAAADIKIDDQINQTVHYVYQQIAQISVEQGIEVSFENVVNPPWMQAVVAEDN